MDKKCVIIGAGINITPARLALINADVNDGDFVALVGVSGDALNALAEFARQVYQDLSIDVKSITVNTQVSLVDAVSMLRGLVEANSPCSVVIGIAGDRWIATIPGFLVMVLATVGVLLMLALIGSSSCLVRRINQLTGQSYLGSLT
jgi:hypothetical protein